MSALPKPLIILRANLLSAGMRWRLRQTQDIPAQHRTWRTLVGKMALTQHGRSLRLDARMRYEQFQSHVPLHSYERIAPLIERMQCGEADLLWPGQCTHYVATAGTTDQPRLLPVTADMSAHFSRAIRDALLYFTARNGCAGLLSGRRLCLFDSAQLSPLELPDNRFTAYAGDLGTIVHQHLPSWMQPPADASIPPEPDVDWSQRLQTLAAANPADDITVLGGLPHWLQLLANSVRAQQTSAQTATPASGWTHLRGVFHWGVPFEPFAEELRRTFGPAERFHEVYPSAEGFIAAQDSVNAHGLRLMTDAGLFFEFLPWRDYEEGRLAELGAKAVPLEGVRTGVNYLLLLTTPGGLCRYASGDVVRFTSTKPPRLLYAGRAPLALRAFGEHVLERELTDALVNVCARHDWQIVNFHVAPVFLSSLTGRIRGLHEWWVELKPRTIETPTGPTLAPALDAELQRLNEEYAARRRLGAMEPPLVRLVMPGVFEQWMRQSQRWGAAHRMPRSCNDRTIADELAQLARFSY
ncbi:MAG: GH3 auxin-responsive promoter family protein [Opitutae bacterium]|nr:GH3 auxin-responsive promoter family protein [Opitutae bacterium]